MTANLIITGRYRIDEVSDCVKIKGTKIKISDIATIRYRFSNYTKEDVDYIKQSLKQFKHSTHIVEMNVDNNIVSNVEALSTIYDKVAKFGYIDINDNDVENNSVDGLYINRLAQLRETYGFKFDRLMLRDNSSTLFTVSLNKMKVMLARTFGYNMQDIGVCNSPLSHFDNNACLTALTARKLAVYYNDDPIAVPSNKAETGCGCLKALIVTDNCYYQKPVAKKTVKQTKVNNKKESHKESTKNNAHVGKVIQSLTSW